MVEDLLFAMSSIDGVYIKRNNSQDAKFAIEPEYPEPTCDISLQFLVSKMLPMCDNHDFILDFTTVHS